MRIAQTEQALGRTLTAYTQVGHQGGKIVFLIKHQIHFPIEYVWAMAKPV